MLFDVFKQILTVSQIPHKAVGPNPLNGPQVWISVTDGGNPSVRPHGVRHFDAYIRWLQKGSGLSKSVKSPQEDYAHFL